MITIWPEHIQSDQYFVNIELQAGPDGAEDDDDDDDGDDDVIHSSTYDKVIVNLKHLCFFL